MKKCVKCGADMKEEVRCPECDYVDTSTINTFIYAFSAGTIIIFILFGLWIINQ
ncbi:hypothetical protein N9A28_03890 [Sulfurimonas sp.]|nr:hypothetical protein [Sulfurimonas sp.]